MKLAIKKIYCPTCQKLVYVREENTATGVHFVCQKCKNVIWNKDNYAWRYNKPAD
jgi:endogenous inhibitor of DNA gyrase (YacG/DUF329 family)